jgi:hypothetical protein
MLKNHLLRHHSFSLTDIRSYNWFLHRHASIHETGKASANVGNTQTVGVYMLFDFLIGYAPK